MRSDEIIFALTCFLLSYLYQFSKLDGARVAPANPPISARGLRKPPNQREGFEKTTHAGWLNPFTRFLLARRAQEMRAKPATAGSGMRCFFVYIQQQNHHKSTNIAHI